MNNKLNEIQEMLINQMKRLDNNEIMKEDAKVEIARGNALSQNATTFIKSVNLGIRVLEISKKYDIQTNNLTRDLGLYDEE